MNRLLILLIILIIATIIYKFRFTKENFSSMSTINITFCPFRTTEFVDKNGNTMCCKGKVDYPNRTCLDSTLCTLSSTNKAPSCSKIYTDYINKQQNTFCNSKFSTYFETDKIKGCTNNSVSYDRTKVNVPNPIFCKVYDTDKENITAGASCYLYKYIDKMACNKFKNCQKDAAFGLVPIAYNSKIISTTDTKYKMLFNSYSTNATQSSCVDLKTANQIMNLQKTNNTEVKNIVDNACVDLKYSKMYLRELGMSDKDIDKSVRDLTKFVNFC